jgi:hypothetical protein
MAGEKFLFSNADGFSEESAAAITTSAGSGDADKLVKTNSAGKLDSSLIDFKLIKKYFLARASTTAALPAVTYANGTLGVGATLTADANGALPAQDGVTLIIGDVLLVRFQAAALQNGLFEVTQLGDGSNPFILTRAADYDETDEIEDGTAVAVGEGTDNADRIFIMTSNDPLTVGTDAINFQNVGTSTIDDGDGLVFVGNRLDVDLLASGGLKFVGATPNGELGVEPADFAGTGLQDDGSDNLEIDFADTATEMGTSRAVAASDLSANGANQGAKILGADPTNIPQSSQTTIQGILEDLSSYQNGSPYTAGAGGVTIGDVVYIDSNDTVLPYSTLTDNEEPIGVALSTEAAAATVFVARDNIVVAGVLTGATAGDRYYWTGTAHSATQPATGGSHVWKTGAAKNATDLEFNLDFIKKNVQP